MKKEFFFSLSFFLLFIISASAQSNEEIWEQYAQKKFDRVISMGNTGLGENPDNIELKYAIGRALADKGSFQEAIPYLQAALNHEQKSAVSWSYAYLGKCFYFTDHYLQSKNNYLKCLELNATKNSSNFARVSLESFQMDNTFDSWAIKESPNIRFHFQDIKKIEDLEQFMKERELAYQHINNFFNANLNKKIDFFVWEKPEDAVKVFGKELGFANSEFMLINSTKHQTRGHEIAHVLSHHGAGIKLKKKLINEGLAVCFDLTSRNKLDEAKAALAGKEINLLELWNNESSFPTTYYYAIGGAWIEFLLQKGSKEQLLQLLQYQTPEAGKKIYADFEQLVAEFENSLRS